MATYQELARAPGQAWRVDTARRSRQPRAALCSPAHLALALASARLAAHVAWAPAGGAESLAAPTPAPGRLAVRLDGGLVGATVELGALRRAAGCLLALQAALTLEQNPGPALAAAPPAAGAAGVAGRMRLDWEVRLALQSLRIDVRARLHSHLSEAVRPAGLVFAPRLLGTPRAAAMLGCGTERGGTSVWHKFQAAVGGGRTCNLKGTHRRGTVLRLHAELLLLMHITCPRAGICTHLLLPRKCDMLLLMACTKSL
jgi:hypothetical protein